jgi:hypothetical protein
MKKLFIIILLVAGTTITFAQCPIDKGQIQLNAGIGASSSNMLPFYAGLDYGVYKDITVGGTIVSYSQTLVAITANGNYHFNSILDISTKWDLYAGLGIGYNIWSGSASEFAINVQIGARYYFTKKFGINVEYGGGYIFTTGAKIGVSLKI